MRSLLVAADIVVLLGLSLTRPFVGVLLFCWISFMNPHQLTWGFASSFPWALLAFIATVIGFCVAHEPKRLPITGVTVSILLFLTAITLTTPFALAPADLVINKYFIVVKVFVFVLIVIAMLTTRRRIHALIWLMAISLGYFGAKGGIFVLVHGGGGGDIIGPPSTMIFDNNHLAVGLLVSLPLMNFLRMQTPHRSVRTALLVVMVLTLLAVLGSYSRGALIALSGVAVFFWLKSRRKLVYGVLTFGVIAGAVAFMPQKWVTRMNSIETYQSDGSAEGRLQMWHTAWLLAERRPLVGAGFMGPYTRSVVDLVDPSSHARAVHSIWFETLGENGFPVLFIWTAIIGFGALASRRIIRRSRDRPDLAWCADLAAMSQVSIIAYVIGGSFLSLEYWDYFFTLIGVIAATDVYVAQTLALPRGVPMQARPAWRRLGIAGGEIGAGRPGPDGLEGAGSAALPLP